MIKQNLSSLYRKLVLPGWSVPLAVLALGLIAYGILLPSLGFYWDDWAKIAVSKLFGLNGYWGYYAGDRPLSAWTHILFTPLLGDHPFNWQIFQFGLEVLSAAGFYWAFSLLWPRARWQVAAGALLFLVYPVFTARATAVTFHQQWLQFGLYFLSLGWMLLAARRWPPVSRAQTWRFWLFSGIGVVFSLAQLSITEYFAPLELLRPLLLWLAIPQNPDVNPGAVPITPRRRLWLTIQLSAPYLAALGVYGLWRFFLLHGSSGNDPYSMSMLFAFFQKPLATLLTLAPVVLEDTLYSLVSVWGPPLAVNPLADLSPFQVTAEVLSLVAAGFVFVFLARLGVEDLQGDENRAWRRQALGIGAAAFLLGILPAWITGRQVVFDFHSDRYALPAMLGASLLWVVFIDWLAAIRLKRALLVAVLIFLSTGLQLRTANNNRWLWVSETRFFWQLSWRVPYLEPGTTLLTYDETFPNQGLFSLSSALNLLYPPTPGSETLPYWWYTLTPRYENQPIVEPISISFQTQFRTLKFSGQTPNTLLVNYDPSNSNCLWVITPQDKDEPGLPGLVKKMSSLTNLERIRPEAPHNWRPSSSLFGPEAVNSWCYFYEKADLARQLKDWKTAAALGDEALAYHFTPLAPGSNTPHEWLPFIEAHARLGSWEKAAGLTVEAAQIGTDHYPILWGLWSRLQTSTPDSPEKTKAFQAVQFLQN